MSRHGVLRVAVLAVAGGLVVTGCSDGDGPEPTAPPATPRTPTTVGTPTGAGPTTGSATGTEAATPGPDCAGLVEARERLLQATDEELDRLGIDRSDPRAFNVQVIVTGQRAAEYWTTVRDELADADPQVQADATAVVDYWEPLDADLEEIEIPDGSEAAVAAATERYEEISDRHPEGDVVAAQERVRAHVETVCGDAPGS